jgi:hypothetical protein
LAADFRRLIMIATDEEHLVGTLATLPFNQCVDLDIHRTSAP